jgi:CDP-diacylglycerol---glycerol-3-phosphate 3-phosphatidyltransferase
MTQATPEPDRATSAPGILNAANILTGVRVLLVPVFGWLLLSHPDDPVYRILSVVVFVVASVTDRIDGELARRHGLVTEVGKLADPIADKALMGMALIGLSLLGELAWWVTVVMLVREVGVTVLRFVVLRRGVIPASRGGKLKTMVQAVAIGLYLLPLPSEWHVLAQIVMAVAFILTVVTGVDYVVSALTRARRQPA